MCSDTVVCPDEVEHRDLRENKNLARLLLAIVQAPDAVDVIDTASQARAKSIPTKGGVHNTYLTPDGKYVVAGSIVGKNMTVIYSQTEQIVWSLEFDLGVRPMAFEQNADGSTKRIFFQLSDFHGFAALDFQTRKEIARIKLPPLPSGKLEIHEGGNISHGMAVTADWAAGTVGTPAHILTLATKAGVFIVAGRKIG